MENKRVDLFKTFIGKDLSNSPSPYAKWLKGILRAVTETSLSVEFLIRKEMTNPVGMLHGGVTAGMIDDVMGANVFLLDLGEFYASVTLNVDFFASAREGEKVTVTTNVVKKGRTVINLSAKVCNEAGKVLAQASSNVVNTHIKF